MYIKEAYGKYSYSRPKKDITGQKFGKLLVLEWLGFKYIGSKKEKRKSFYKCQCECGNFTEVDQSSLSTGNTKSCGCNHKLNKSTYKGENYAIISKVLNNYIQSAKRRKIEFFLTRTEFEEIIRSNCHYCNISPNNILKPDNNIDKDNFLYNGIDRKDNSKGYTKDNVVPCCKQCNFLKRDINYTEFLKIVKNIYEWRIKSN